MITRFDAYIPFLLQWISQNSNWRLFTTIFQRQRFGFERIFTLRRRQRQSQKQQFSVVHNDASISHQLSTPKFQQQFSIFVRLATVLNFTTIRNSFVTTILSLKNVAIAIFNWRRNLVQIVFTRGNRRNENFDFSIGTFCLSQSGALLFTFDHQFNSRLFSMFFPMNLFRCSTSRLHHGARNVFHNDSHFPFSSRNFTIFTLENLN